MKKNIRKMIIGLTASAIAVGMLATAAFAGEAPQYTDNYGGLIAGGQIFTGNEMDMVNAKTGEKVHIKELNQGGYTDDNGVIYNLGGGGSDLFYGNDGTVLTFPENFGKEEINDELIAGGKIFTGNEMTLYKQGTDEKVLVKELNQGGWADDQTGVIYTQGAGGAEFFYGNDGSVLVTYPTYLHIYE